MKQALEGCSLSPYWWDDVPRPLIEQASLPATVDVAIVGSGYTGLHCALQTARGGRSTLVFDAQDAGWGASSRNGGQVSTGVKPGFDQLSSRHGAARATDILKEGQRSLEWLGEFIRDERLACDFVRCGHIHAAHTPAHYETLAREVERQPKELAVDVHLVPQSEFASELGSNVYHGGAVYTRHCSVHPARYHQGLLDLVIAAGAQVVPHCPVTRIEKEGALFRVTTPKGAVLARDVVVATNGYTQPVTPWLRRRVIPIGSYMIATEELPQGLVDRLIPRNRTVTETRKVIYYYRASPDRKRILFGGRVSSSETDPALSGPLLHAAMAKTFPELAAARVSHSWCGFIAYTFDELLHIGKHDGIHYAMGYCGTGIATASYFGMRLGQQVLGLPQGRTAFDGLAFQTRPFYTGKPWFLAASVSYYRWRDRQSF